MLLLERSRETEGKKKTKNKIDRTRIEAASRQNKFDYRPVSVYPIVLTKQN